MPFVNRKIQNLKGIRIYKMDWELRDFDENEDDSVDAHIVKEKGKIILRRVAMDDLSEKENPNQNILCQKTNCVYDLFKLPNEGKFDQFLGIKILFF